MFNSIINNRPKVFRPFRFSYCMAGVVAIILSIHCIGRSQVEVLPWSNIKGMRVDGQLIALNTSLCLQYQHEDEVWQSEKEKARYHFSREGASQKVRLHRGPITFHQSVNHLGGGNMDCRLQLSSEVDTFVEGAWLKLHLPRGQYGQGQIEYIDPVPTPLDNAMQAQGNEVLLGLAHGFKIQSGLQSIEVRSSRALGIKVFQDQNFVDIFLEIARGFLSKDSTYHKSLSFRCSGAVNYDPVFVQLGEAPSKNRFMGFGGNFRLQNPETDPAVIDYCLDQMDVRYARVEMPWRSWHLDEHIDPLRQARRGDVHPKVDASLTLAQRFSKAGMPIILSCWFPPDWAILGERHRGPVDGIWGNALNPEKMEAIYASIADYIEYAKRRYKVEFIYFSFNESDLGIDVRQTAEEHQQFIKGFGAYLKERGLSTKLLLGDTADANGWPFTQIAKRDSTLSDYLGAVSFHSWRGYEDDNLLAWRAIADTLHLPLIIGEGSMDAGAWRYPDVFSEPTYAREEINLYLRIMRLCQPQTLLQWQLTADYSPLKGGGVFGQHDHELQPTQRFFHFKQLAATPGQLAYWPMEWSGDHIEAVALGDVERKQWTLHIMNNGAQRELNITGLPPSVVVKAVYLTNESRSVSRSVRTRLIGDVLQVTIESASFLTMILEEK